MAGQAAEYWDDLECREDGLRLAGCPQPGCAGPAQVRAETLLDSTAGPVRHARTYCVNRHHFQCRSARYPNWAQTGAIHGRTCAKAKGAGAGMAESEVAIDQGLGHRPDHRYLIPIATTRTPSTRRIASSGSLAWILAPV